MRHRSVAAVHLGRARVHGHTQGRPQECVLQQSLRSMSVAPPATGAGRVEWIGTLSTIFLHQKEMSDKKHYVNYIHLHRQPVPMARARHEPEASGDDLQMGAMAGIERYVLVSLLVGLLALERR